jgi:formate dehydrogenase iron-sulfur subunit
MSARNISRRSFLKRVGAGGAALTAAWLLDGPSLAYASGGKSEPGWGVLIDLTRCDGCNSCALACKENWGLPRADVVPEALSSDAYAFVETRQVLTAGGQELTRYIKHQCMHCLDAACVSACPAAAMYKSAEGAVRYRAERCLGCRYCQVACPFGVPRFDWDNGVNPVISKCQMCYDLLQQGQAPACVQDCPTGALRFGMRQDLLIQARAQIVSNPGRYVDHVFGELEVGGTAMLYLSDVPFEQLGFPTLSHTAPPEETEKIMSKLPYVLGGILALTAGTAAYTHSGSLKSADEQGE